MVRRLKTGRGFGLSRGFTLLEMMIVMVVMGILISIAIPIYSRSVVRAREAVLNKLISQYTLDKQKAPQSLDDLKSAGYIKDIPKDPMTGEANWEVDQEDVLLSVDQQDPGIVGAHSASNAVSLEGTPYSSWR
jgi:general secretion pathway protein G